MSFQEMPHRTLISATRAFVLALVGIPVLWNQNTDAILGLTCLVAISLIGSVATKQSQASFRWTLRVETIAATLTASLFLEPAPSLLAYLALPTFIQGLVRSYRGVAESLVLQLLVLSGTSLLQPARSFNHLSDLFTWLATGLGIGLISAFFGREDRDANTIAYAEARSLILELSSLSAKLEGGLDPTSMGGAILEEVGAVLPLEQVALHVQRDSMLLPLVTLTPDEGLAQAHETKNLSLTDALPQQAWDSGEVVVEGHDFAFPVRSGGITIAVVTGRLASGLNLTHEPLAARLQALAKDLAPTALRLDTAQLFSAFRDAAMSEERRRLAREMHDGMAQDIASMGYVVDALVSTASTPQQEQALTQLRSMITRVVAEVRRAVMTLRTQAGASESLGAAIATLARHLSDVSGTPIKVTVDERTSRLRHEVEAELLRITQEAMNNAVKHSKATLIDVNCRVQAPHAEITVTDDGIGLQAGRRDSHGLSIMRERAALIGGVLEVRSSPTRGTEVSVRVGAPEHRTFTEPHHVSTPHTTWQQRTGRDPR